MKVFILFLFSLLSFGATMAQSRAAIDSLDRKYQACTSRKGNLYGCVLTYYKSMDSLLNTSYHQLYTKLDSTHKRGLEQEQQSWEEKKTAYFELLDARVGKVEKKTLNGLDDRMISTDNKAAYLRNRVLQLSHLAAN